MSLDARGAMPMMTPELMFLAGSLTGLLLAILIFVTVRGVRTAERDARRPPHPPIHALRHPLRVLLAVDGSTASDHAVREAAALAWPKGSRFHVVNAVHSRIPPLPDMGLALVAAHAQQEHEQAEAAPRTLRLAVDALQEVGAELPVTSIVLEDAPGRAIVREAGEWGADVIVVGSHGHGVIAPGMLGSVSQHVAAHAPCSVLIVRDPAAAAAGGHQTAIA